MKRKLLSLEDQKTTKTAKMMEIEMEQNNSLIITNVSDVSSSLSQHFNYEMTDQKAKSNFIRGASREALEVLEKQKCNMLIFSVGAYLEVVMPAVEKWTNALGNIIINDNVMIEKVTAGYDENNKHLQTTIKFRFNKEIVTVTCYNTTQKIKVEGRGYLGLANNFLEPFFQKKLCGEVLDRIEKYNRDVIASLSGKRKAVSRPLRSVKYKASAKLPCSKCDNVFSNHVQLSKHKLVMHTRGNNDSVRSFKNIPIVDNISLLDTSNEEPEVKALTLVESEPLVTNDNMPPQTQNHQSNTVEIEDASFYCKICGKCFEDFDLLEEHSVEKHEQILGIKCRNCDKSFPDSKLLQTHEKEEHEVDEMIIQDSKQPDFKCSLCGKVIRTKIGIQRHAELFCDECKKCSAERVSFDIHNELHRRNPRFKCEECDFSTEDNTSLISHVQTIHNVVKIDIKVEDQAKINCEQCEYKCRLNIQLKKHMLSVHEEVTKNYEEVTKSLKCKTCQFTSNYVLHMWEHRLTKHPDNFPLHPKDMAFALLAEQGHDIIEEIETLKKDTKGSLIELTKGIGMGFIEASNEMNDKFNAMKAAMEILNKKMDTILNREAKETKTKTEEIDENKIEPTKNKQECKKTKNKLDIAWVGSSISKVMDIKQFEKYTRSNVKFVRADEIAEENESTYPKEAQRFPDRTFTKVVPETIENNDVDILVMQGGSIEISNIKVNEALMDTSKNIQDYKQEWFDKVENDTKNLFKIAEEAVKSKPGLKVVIVKRLPRFDRSSQDILGIKAILSKYANSIYDQLWTKSGSPQNIKIEELILDVEKPGFLRNLIFGSDSENIFDGIHLLGRGGSRHFTYRAGQAVQKILPHYRQPLLRTSLRDDNHTECPQARYKQQRRLGSQSISKTNLEDYNHTDCPQARYQKQRGPELGKSYADVVKSRYTYSIPTSNMFNPLN